MELLVEVGDTELPATLTTPVTRPRGGVVVLHGAEAGHRSFVRYEHLARLLPTAGVAVLRYDRRPAQDGGDVPLARRPRPGQRAGVGRQVRYPAMVPARLCVGAPAGGTSTVTVVRLPGCQHLPTVNGGRSLASVSPRYSDKLLGWLDELLPPAGA